MRKLVKFLKSLKKLKKYHIFTKYFLRRSKISYIDKKPIVSITKEKVSHYGNLEFAVFFSLVGFGLFYIHHHRQRMNETVRLIAAGIATHIVVDFVTYFGDKINTKVKVENFYKKKDMALKDVNFFFEKQFMHFRQAKQIKRKRNIAQKSLGHYLGEFHFRGIQAAMVFVTINSIIFYGLYKNLKYFLKEKFGFSGFFNFFMSAGIAQFVAMVFAFPLENIKTRMQASNFHYDSFFKYYKKLIKGKPWSIVFNNIKNEYSGFVSHLLLYVVYESVTFGIYETIMKYYSKKVKNGKNENSKNSIDELNNPLLEMENPTHDDIHDVNFNIVILASVISGLVSAIVTNPIDVYQINKQVNPKFSMNQLNKENIMTGMKERIYFITFLNLCTFLFLESIATKYYDVRLE
jgi:hypothetical protein